MKISFDKYQGAGNDFVIIDNRLKDFQKNKAELIQLLCHRRYGIGADGLILVEDDPTSDFRMVYFNSDGKESSMCGNGGRCAAAFAYAKGISANELNFIAIDGLHQAKVQKDYVQLKMLDVENVNIRGKNYIMDTGSPHFVRIMDEDIAGIDIASEARVIRYSDEFSVKGINVNFLNTASDNKAAVRTYERGVEAETYSCGTGVVASAISTFLFLNNNQAQPREVNSYLIETKGGKLEVTFNYNGYNKFSNIWLKGPAEFVFSGEFQLPVAEVKKRIEL